VLNSPRNQNMRLEIGHSYFSVFTDFVNIHKAMTRAARAASNQRHQS